MATPSVPIPAQPSVYISHAPEDAAWRDRIASHLSDLGFHVWEDSQTSMIQRFLPAAEPGVEGARVFILLVSHYYLSYDEIHKTEFPYIRSLVDSQRARVIYVVLEQCPWQNVVLLPVPKVVVVPEGNQTLSERNPDQIMDDLYMLAREVRRAIQETDRAVAPAPKQRTSSRLPTKGQRHRELDSVNAPLMSEESAPLADAPQYARDSTPTQVQSPQVQPPLARLLAAKLLISSQSGEYRAMATLLSSRMAITSFQAISDSGLLKDPSPSVTLECLGAASVSLSATLGVYDELAGFAVLQLLSPVPFELPKSLIRTTVLLRGSKWESSFSPELGGLPEVYGGQVKERAAVGGKSYLELALSNPSPKPGISGARSSPMTG